MAKQRIAEVNAGFKAEEYDEMMRKTRDEGHLYTDEIIKMRLNSGTALEIGPGPGYLGLEWLKKTTNTRLVGLDTNKEMVRISEKNSKEYGLFNERTKYVVGNAEKMPFEGNSFDAVFSNSVLHECNDPVQVLNEVNRVLKPGGQFYISDLRRDMNFFAKSFMKKSTPKSMVQGLISSINAAYTHEEITDIFNKSELAGFNIFATPFSLIAKGVKPRIVDL